MKLRYTYPLRSDEYFLVEIPMQCVEEDEVWKHVMDGTQPGSGSSSGSGIQTKTKAGTEDQGQGQDDDDNDKVVIHIKGGMHHTDHGHAGKNHQQQQHRENKDAVHDKGSKEGMKGEQVVLCTKERTYMVQMRENTNSMLLVDLGNQRDGETQNLGEDKVGKQTEAEQEREKEIMASLHGVIELLPIHGSTRHLNHLLESAPCKFAYSSSNNTPQLSYSQLQGISYPEMVANTLASEREIKRSLDASMGIRIDNRYYKMQEESVRETLSLIFDTMVIEGWSITMVPKEELIREMEKCVPRLFVERVVQVFQCDSKLVEEDEDDHKHKDKKPRSDFNLIALDPRKIMKFMGERVLKSLCIQENKCSLDEFNKQWVKALPDEVAPDMSALQGMYITTRSRNITYLQYFPVSELPMDCAQRFEVLFEKREAWTRDEIEPFVLDLVPPGKTCEFLLRKYAREIKSLGAVTGPTTYRSLDRCVKV